MNKGLVSGLFGFVIGAGCGVAGTYIYMKKRYEELLTLPFDWGDDDEIKDDLELPFDSESGTLINPDPEILISSGARTREQYTNYAKQYSGNDRVEDEHPVDSDEDEDEEYTNEDVENVRLTEEVNDLKKNIYEIEYEEYDSMPQHDKETLMYYMSDGVLTDEDDVIIDNVNDVVGDVIATSGFDIDNSSSIYVRNAKLAVDYEIIKVRSAYNDNM